MMMLFLAIVFTIQIYLMCLLVKSSTFLTLHGGNVMALAKNGMQLNVFLICLLQHKLCTHK